MSDNKTTSSDLDLLIASMNDLARKIGEMEPDDPVRAVRLKELYTLTELSKSLNTQPSKIIDGCLADELELKAPEKINKFHPTRG
jgi:hypothetical protein